MNHKQTFTPLFDREKISPIPFVVVKTYIKKALYICIGPFCVRRAVVSCAVNSTE